MLSSVTCAGIGEDVVIEMMKGSASVPADRTSNYTVELVWKPTTFDRYV
jgi:hypothetical protein